MILKHRRKQIARSGGNRYNDCNRGSLLGIRRRRYSETDEYMKTLFLYKWTKTRGVNFSRCGISYQAAMWRIGRAFLRDTQ